MANLIEETINEYKNWCKAVRLDDFDKLNEALRYGYGKKLINVCEARQERKFAEIADQVFYNMDKCPIVMIAGPSSSGKTSSSKRISQQLSCLGILPKIIELDNYFKEREQTPKDENGNYDFDCIGAMDIDLLNSNLKDLLKGKSVITPTFDFVNGKKSFDPANEMRLEKGDVLIMEGIHALNPAFTPKIDQDKIFKIYVAPLTALFNMDQEYCCSGKRLVRRIVRDNRTRGIKPEENIQRWPSVRRGEAKNIVPFRDNANVVFNSSVLYDIPLLRYFAEPLLYGIAETSPAYSTAQKLLEGLSFADPLKPSEIAVIPPTSIMREFIGGQELA